MSASRPGATLAQRVVRWQRAHGRHHLPWQQSRDPYRVWLSEVMLQQTQVATVLDYYPRFLQRFPDVQSLAAASLDEVLGLWSGLGYYSRARNLHRCAQQVVAEHGGAFPRDAASLQRLAGIGRSTAAAIASLCAGERVAIMDANVRRVLTRVLGFGHDLAQAAHERALWQAAEELLPAGARARQDMPAYTQGMMDLGALVCLPRRPRCEECPLQADCVAHAQGRPGDYPVRTRRVQRKAVALWLLVLRSSDGGGQVWLQRRPAHGVWAGLHCVPAFDSEDALRTALPTRWRKGLRMAPAFVHVLTHRDLHLHPCHLDLPAQGVTERWNLEGQWFPAADWPALGLPAPVRRLLQQVQP